MFIKTKVFLIKIHALYRFSLKPVKYIHLLPVRRIYDGSLSWQKPGSVRKLCAYCPSMVCTLIFFSFYKKCSFQHICQDPLPPFNYNIVIKKEKKTLRITHLFFRFLSCSFNRKVILQQMEGGKLLMRRLVPEAIQSFLFNSHWSCAWKTQELPRQFPLSYSNLMKQSWLSKSKWEEESKHFCPHNKMCKIGFFFFSLGGGYCPVLFCFQVK